MGWTRCRVGSWLATAGLAWAPAAAWGQAPASGTITGKVYDRDKGCTVYRVRPAQCRTWPFWESNLATPEDWQRTTEICPGSGEGELIPVEDILRRVKVVKI